MRMKLKGWGILHYPDICALFFAHVFIKRNETKKEKEKSPTILCAFVVFNIYNLFPFYGSRYCLATKVNMVGKGLCCLGLIQESETGKGNLNLEFSD